MRVVLNTGEIETLITNLPEKEFETACFKDLYFMRWSIEGKYNSLKNKLLMEHFSGKTRLAIEQDFYAAICAANLITLTKGADDEIICQENAQKSLKYKCQANEKPAVKKAKNRLLLIMTEDDSTIRGQLFDMLVFDIARNRSEIRPGRRFPRSEEPHRRRCQPLKTVL